MILKLKNSVVALAIIAMMPIAAAWAADPETNTAPGLMTSGSLEFWGGLDFLSSFHPSGAFDMPKTDPYETYGLEAKLGLVVTDSLSIQQDVKLEYNSEYGNTHKEWDINWHRNQWQITTHVSFLRDPERGLIGLFGGIGGGKVDGANAEMFSGFGGAEFQYYYDAWTFQGQVGFLDTRRIHALGAKNDMFRDAWFGRAVVQWYITPDSRLQLEGSYADGISDRPGAAVIDDAQVIEWGARYDRLVGWGPLPDNTNLFVRYRGNYVSNFEADWYTPFFNPESYTSHTVMLGAVWKTGGGSRMENDRTGVALDSPDIVRWAQTGEILD